MSKIILHALVSLRRMEDIILILANQLRWIHSINKPASQRCKRANNLSTNYVFSQKMTNWIGLAYRQPFLLETIIPGIFAAGDVRHGSIKRIAAGVGEGSTTIQLIHEYLKWLRNTMIMYKDTAKESIV